MATASQVIRRTYAPSMNAGQVYARPYGSAAKPTPIGNVLALTLEHSEDVQTQPDLTRAGGGIHAEVRRVTGMTVSMTLADLNVTNLARAVLGTVAGIDSGVVTGEVHTNITKGSLLRLAHINPTNVVVTQNSLPAGSIADESHVGVNQGDTVVLAHPPTAITAVKVGADLATAATVPAAGNYTLAATGVLVTAAAPDIPNDSRIFVTYEHGSVAGSPVAAAGNYEVRAEGVFVLEDAASIADEASVSVAYEYGAYATIDALTQAATELELTFGGLNEADSGKPVLLEIWRASQGVTSSLAMLQESGFGNLEVTGAVLQDPGKAGVGVSKYYRVSKA